MNVATPIISHYLAQHPIINSLTDPQLQELEYNSSLKTLKKGEFISFPQMSRNIYLILSGRIKIYEIEDDGSSFIKELLKEGDFFGETYGTNPPIQVECAEASSNSAVVSIIAYSVFEEISQKNYKFSNGFNQIIWKRYKQIELRYRNLAFLKDTKSRLISLLAEWAKDDSERLDNKIILETDLTHKDIASLICSTRVTVTNIFNELRDAGEINYSKGRIEIKLPIPWKFFPVRPI